MARYHVNPTTGEVGVCRARKRCPFGDMVTDHYSTAGEAQEAFEMKQGTQLPPKQQARRFTMELTPATRRVVDILHSQGMRPLLVGGCVRDVFLGRESKDVDMEVFGSRPDGTSLTFEDVRRPFKGLKEFKVDEAGASFSVLKVRLGEEDFDISLPRTEQSTGEHHRDYALKHDSTMTFAEASSRRDFTMNSMAYDPLTGELVDPHGGTEDMEQGLLRHVGEAFSDDPLRCLRAMNFASRFNYRAAPETLELMQGLAPAYKTLARERVEEEFTKALMKGKHLATGLETLHDMGWSKEMEPFALVSRQEFTLMGKRLDATPLELRRAVLARSMKQLGHPDPTPLLTSTVKDQQLVDRTNALLEASRKGPWGSVVAAHRRVKEGFPEITNASLEAALRVTGDEASVMKRLPETPVAPVVTGRELIERGFKPGPEMGKILKRAQALQDDEGLTSFEELLARALREG